MVTSLSLNGVWHLVYDPNDSYSVDQINQSENRKISSIPSVFNVDREGAGYRGVVWYFRELTLPSSVDLFEIKFEGWYGKAEFFIDNSQVGARDYGYTPYSIFLKNDLQDGQNKVILKVRIDNRAQPGQTFRTPVFRQWGGIHRNVSICFYDSGLFTRVFFESSVSSFLDNHKRGTANITIKTLIYNCSEDLEYSEHISAELFDSKSQVQLELSDFSADSDFPKEFYDYIDVYALSSIISECKSSKMAEKIKLSPTALKSERTAEFSLWCPDSPILYTLKVKINDYNYEEKVGIRSIQTNKEGELLLNGTPCLFLGVNRHDEHPEFGPAFSPQLISHDLQMMKDAGYTGIRPAHYPTTEFFLNMCDHLGIMVMEEVPNYIMMPDMMKNDQILGQGKAMFKEMIQNHYNHPSVIIWSAANECKSHLPESKEMINNLCSLGRKIDNSRLYHFTGYPGIQNIAEIKANIAGINVYYGDSTSGTKLGPETLGSVLDNLRDFMVDEDLNLGENPIFITEFGSQATYGYHDIHPYHAVDGYSVPHTIYTEERQAYVIEKFYDQVLDKNFVAGLLVWCWRDNRYEPEIADSCAGATMKYGLLDWSGSPKLGFHVLKESIKKLKEYRKNAKK